MFVPETIGKLIMEEASASHSSCDDQNNRVIFVTDRVSKRVFVVDTNYQCFVWPSVVSDKLMPTKIKLHAVNQSSLRTFGQGWGEILNGSLWFQSYHILFWVEIFFLNGDLLVDVRRQKLRLFLLLLVFLLTRPSTGDQFHSRLPVVLLRGPTFKVIDVVHSTRYDWTSCFFRSTLPFPGSS